MEVFIEAKYPACIPKSNRAERVNPYPKGADSHCVPLCFMLY